MWCCCINELYEYLFVYVFFGNGEGFVIQVDDGWEWYVFDFIGFECDVFDFYGKVLCVVQDICGFEGS